MSVAVSQRRPCSPPFIDPPGYARHRPEATLLYQLVEQHFPTFCDVRAAAGWPLPDYVQEEFDACLKCGRLEEGFLRVRFFVLFTLSFFGIAARIHFALSTKPEADDVALAARIVPDYCHAPVTTPGIEEGRSVAIGHAFDARCRYWSSGLSLAGGARYRIEVELLPTPTREIGPTLPCQSFWQPDAGSTPSTGTNGVGTFWWDMTERADLFGLSDPDAEPGIGGALVRGGKLLARHLTYAPGLMLRRDITQPWFTLHARFGTEGRAEVPLLPLVPPGSEPSQRKKLVSEFTARRSGPLYLYVNDAVNLPCVDFYANNHGRAKVSIMRLGWDATFNK